MCEGGGLCSGAYIGWVYFQRKPPGLFREFSARLSWFDYICTSGFRAHGNSWPRWFVGRNICDYCFRFSRQKLRTKSMGNGIPAHFLFTILCHFLSLSSKNEPWRRLFSNTYTTRRLGGVLEGHAAGGGGEEALKWLGVRKSRCALGIIIRSFVPFFLASLISTPLSLVFVRGLAQRA